MLGQDMPAIVDAQGNPVPEIIPYDPSLPYTRPGAKINNGCPDGYFAQFMPPGDLTAVHVTIPGVASDSWLRCRLMATTTQQTIADESGKTAADSWYNYTNTGMGGLFGDFLNRLGTLGTYALVGLGVYLLWPMVRGSNPPMRRRNRRPGPTLQEARRQLQPYGITVNRTDYGEFRVARRGSRQQTEPSAYYTSDLDDALHTGLAMVSHRRA